MHTIANVTDLIPFAGGHEEDNDPLYLRTNPLQEGGDDDLGLTIGPITRSKLRRIQETKLQEPNGL